MLPARALQWSSIGKTLLAEDAAAKSHREEVANRERRSGKDAAGRGAG